MEIREIISLVLLNIALWPINGTIINRVKDENINLYNKVFNTNDEEDKEWWEREDDYPIASRSSFFVFMTNSKYFWDNELSYFTKSLIVVSHILTLFDICIIGYFFVKSFS